MLYMLPSLRLFDDLILLEIKYLVVGLKMCVIRKYIKHFYSENGINLIKCTKLIAGTSNHK